VWGLIVARAENLHYDDDFFNSRDNDLVQGALPDIEDEVVEARRQLINESQTT
jgi:hypothetical protein